jgi:hypothetical protein
MGALFGAEDQMDEKVCGGVAHFLTPLRGFLVFCFPPTPYGVGFILALLRSFPFGNLEPHAQNVLSNVR